MYLYRWYKRHHGPKLRSLRIKQSVSNGRNQIGNNETKKKNIKETNYSSIFYIPLVHDPNNIKGRKIKCKCKYGRSTLCTFQQQQKHKQSCNALSKSSMIWFPCIENVHVFKLQSHCTISQQNNCFWKVNNWVKWVGLLDFKSGVLSICIKNRDAS